MCGLLFSGGVAPRRRQRNAIGLARRFPRSSPEIAVGRGRSPVRRSPRGRGATAFPGSKAKRQRWCPPHGSPSWKRRRTLQLPRRGSGGPLMRLNYRNTPHCIRARYENGCADAKDGRGERTDGFDQLPKLRLTCGSSRHTVDPRSDRAPPVGAVRPFAPCRCWFEEGLPRSRSSAARSLEPGGQKETPPVR
jgi:hypothetical protein